MEKVFEKVKNAKCHHYKSYFRKWYGRFINTDDIFLTLHHHERDKIVFIGEREIIKLPSPQYEVFNGLVSYLMRYENWDEVHILNTYFFKNIVASAERPLYWELSPKSWCYCMTRSSLYKREGIRINEEYIEKESKNDEDDYVEKLKSWCIPLLPRGKMSFEMERDMIDVYTTVIGEFQNHKGIFHLPRSRLIRKIVYHPNLEKESPEELHIIFNPRRLFLLLCLLLKRHFGARLLLKYVRKECKLMKLPTILLFLDLLTKKEFSLTGRHKDIRNIITRFVEFGRNHAKQFEKNEESKEFVCHLLEAISKNG